MLVIYAVTNTLEIINWISDFRGDMEQIIELLPGYTAMLEEFFENYRETALYKVID